MEWESYFLELAKTAATKSKDGTKIGAVLVGHHGEVRLTAFNGIPQGVVDAEHRRERPLKYVFSAHAEANLIAFAARVGIPTDGCTVYTTNYPCAACARTLIQAGIKTIVTLPNNTAMPEDEFLAAKVMFDEAGVTVTQRERIFS